MIFSFFCPRVHPDEVQLMLMRVRLRPRQHFLKHFLTFVVWVYNNAVKIDRFVFVAFAPDKWIVELNAEDTQDVIVVDNFELQFVCDVVLQCIFIDTVPHTITILALQLHCLFEKRKDGREVGDGGVEDLEGGMRF